MNPQRVRVVCRVAIPAEPPERFQIMPWGEFLSNGGKTIGDIPTLADAETLRLIVEAFNARGIDGRIDYDHQSEDEDFKATGKPALILGYFKGFEAVPGDGIYVTNVTWTPPGAELVRNLQARYPSYVGYIRPSDGRVLEVSSIGLTPDPFIAGIKPVVNKRDRLETRNMESEKFERSRYWLNLPETATREEIIMEFEKYISQLREMLGAESSATAEQVINTLKTRLADSSEFRKAVCQAMKLPAAAKDEDVVKAVNAANAQTPAAPAPGTSEEVKALQETLKIVNTELSAVKAENAARRAGERIAEAVREGKLDDKMLAVNSATGKNFYRQLAEGDQWDVWYASAPVIAPPNGRVVNNERGAAGGGQGRKAAEFEKLVAEKVANSGGKLPRHEAWAAVCKERPDLREGLNEPAVAS